MDSISFFVADDYSRMILPHLMITNKKIIVFFTEKYKYYFQKIHQKKFKKNMTFQRREIKGEDKREVPRIKDSRNK